jgi:uncharacterized membrane protein YedE/YeeE
MVLRVLAAAVCGLIFGAGMSLSGMTDPARVLGFFDPLGAWDPTLAFVMGGALIPMVLAWRLRARMSRSVLGSELPGPAPTTIDARLIGGAALFGVGWGVAGVCPGAVVPALVSGGWPIALFFAAMLGGMLTARSLSEPAAPARA